MSSSVDILPLIPNLPGAGRAILGGAGYKEQSTNGDLRSETHLAVGDRTELAAIKVS
jgi:hypothetical protein